MAKTQKATKKKKAATKVVSRRQISRRKADASGKIDKTVNAAIDVINNTEQNKVQKPRHYDVVLHDLNGDDFTCQAVDLMEAVAPGDIHLAHVMPYLVRAGKKDIEGQGGDMARLEDLKKAAWWMNRGIERLEQKILEAAAAVAQKG